MRDELMSMQSSSLSDLYCSKVETPIDGCRSQP